MIFQQLENIDNQNITKTLNDRYKILIELFDKAVVDFYMYDKYNYLYNIDTLEEQINRHGQILFKKQLIDRYQCCVISKNTEETCDAAHIIPYSKLTIDNKYDINNGLLLRTDLHRYFDTKILKINPLTLIVSFNKDWLAKNQNYNEYNNIKININQNSIKYLIEFYKD